MKMYCSKCQEDVFVAYHGAGDWKCTECGNITSAFSDFRASLNQHKRDDVIAVKVRGCDDLFFGYVSSHDAIGINVYEARLLANPLVGNDGPWAMFFPWANIEYARSAKLSEMKIFTAQDEEQK